MFLSAEVKYHYLCALSHLLQWIPKQVLLSELPNVSNVTDLMRHFGDLEKSSFSKSLQSPWPLEPITKRNCLPFFLPQLMPLLVQSLSCEEQSLKLSTLQSMYSLVLDAPEIITRHVTSLVPMLLGLSKFQLSMVIH